MMEKKLLLPQHKGIICDECGVNPIIGARYKASHIYNYDICGICVQDHSAQDRARFVAFHKPPKTQEELDQVCLVEDTCMNAYSLSRAAEMIGKNENNQNALIYLAGGYELDDPEEGSEQLRRALSINTKLEVLHLHMCGLDYTNQCITNIAQGIASNHSIRKLFWYIGNNCRNPITAKGLHDLIIKNTTLDTLFLNRIWRESESSNISNYQSDQFATTIFNALQVNSTLKVVRLGSYNVLSDTTKEALLETIKMNKTIGKVYTEFEYPDHRINLLLACNRKKWIERLMDIDATKRKQIEILDEALIQCSDTSDDEPVATAYHLLRSRPDLCETK